MAAAKLYVSRVATNGQVVIPKELREAMGLRGGDRVLFLVKQGSGPAEVRLRKPAVSFSSKVGALRHLARKRYEPILKRLDREENR